MSKSRSAVIRSWYNNWTTNTSKKLNYVVVPMGENAPNFSKPRMIYILEKLIQKEPDNKFYTSILSNIKRWGVTKKQRECVEKDYMRKCVWSARK